MAYAAMQAEADVCLSQVTTEQLRQFCNVRVYVVHLLCHVREQQLEKATSEQIRFCALQSVKCGSVVTMQ